MKSCRNCEHSVHEGYYDRYVLVCKTYGKTISVTSSTKCIEENKASDIRARKIANVCPEYTGESK